MQRAALGLGVRQFRQSFAISRVSQTSSNLAPRSLAGRRCLSQLLKRSVAQYLQWKPAEKVDGVVIDGYVRSVRSMKAHRFVSLGDGSSLAPLQALVPADQAEGCEQFPWHACLGWPIR